jgi:predicted transcriptional regulator
MKTTAFAVSLDNSLALAIPGLAQETARRRKLVQKKAIVDALVGSWEGTCRTWFYAEQARG